MTYFLVAFGGFLGACFRYFLGHLIAKHSKSVIFGTFFVNISGAFLFGILSGLNVEKNLYILFADGFLAAFTTFSTFMYESFNLFIEQKRLKAFLYIVISLFVGLLSFTLGMVFILYLK